MDREQYEEILGMLTVIYKRLDKLEKKFECSIRMADAQTYLNELRREAGKIKNL